MLRLSASAFMFALVAVPSALADGTVMQGQSVTRLCDGRVLLAGGAQDAETWSVSGNTEIFDPKTGTRTPGPALKQPRWGHSAVLDSRCRVWILGGQTNAADGSNETVFSSTEIFDPATNSFQVGPALPHPRTGASVTLAGDRLVLTGGFDQDGWIKDIDAVSTVAMTSATLGQMQAARLGVVSKFLQIGGDGVVISLGTEIPDSAHLGGDTPFAAEYFDLSHPEKSKVVPLYSFGAQGLGVGFLTDGRILLTGGYSYNPVGGVKSPEWHCDFFDPEEGSLTTCQTLFGLSDQTVVDFFSIYNHQVLDLGSNQVLLVGGQSSINGVTVQNRALTVFNTDTGALSLLESELPIGLSPSAVAMAPGSALLVGANTGMLDIGVDFISYGNESSYGRIWPLVLPAAGSEALLVHWHRSEFYDRKSGQFRKGPDIPFPRISNTILGDGHVFILSASAGSLYDPKSGSFTQASLPQPVAEVLQDSSGAYTFSTSPLGTEVVALTWMPKGDFTKVTTWVFDAAKSTWAPLAISSTGSAGCTELSLLGTPDGRNYALCVPASSMEYDLYAINSGAWTKVGSLPRSDWFSPATLLDMGNQLALIATDESAGIFNLSSGQWTDLGNYDSVSDQQLFDNRTLLPLSPTKALVFGTGSFYSTPISVGIIDTTAGKLNWLPSLPTFSGHEFVGVILGDGSAVAVSSGSLPEVLYVP